MISSLATLPLLVLFTAHATAAPLRPVRTAPLRIACALSEPGRAALAAELERIAAGRFVVVLGPEAAALPRLAEPAVAGEAPVIAVFGYTLPELGELRELDLLRPLEVTGAMGATGAVGGVGDEAATPGDDSHPLDFEGRKALALFADPIVLAIDSARVRSDLGKSPTDVLPSEPAEACSGKFEGQFFTAAPSLSSAAGALFGRLAVTEEEHLPKLLAAFGANLEDRASSSADAALARLVAEGPPAFAMVTESELARFRATAGADCPLEGVRAFGSSLAVVRGVALLPNGGELAPFLAELLAPASLHRIARAEGLVPLRGADTADLEPTDLEVRRGLVFEAPRIVREVEKMRDTITRYQSEWKDRLKNRRGRFEDVYDVVAMAAIALFLLIAVFRRRRANG